MPTFAGSGSGAARSANASRPCLPSRPCGSRAAAETSGRSGGWKVPGGIAGVRISLVSLGTATLALLACASSGTDLASLDSTEQLPNDDRKVWAMSAHERVYLQNAGFLDPGSEVVAYVQEVGERLVPAEFANSIVEFDFQVVLDPEPNAFSLPDGQIFVHLGLLEWLQNESQLAHVLAHEVAHVVHRDAVSLYARRRDTILAARLLGWAAREAMREEARESFWWRLASWTTQSVISVTAMAAISGHGPEAERRADETALELMASAGYDVTEAPRVFENLMRHLPPSALITWFFVDPVQLRVRRDHLEGCVARDRLSAIRSGPAREARPDAAEYRRRTDPARRQLVELWVRSGRYRQAIRTAEVVLDEHPRDGRVWYWLGEARRLAAGSPEERELARQSYRTALSCDPTFGEPHRGLGEVAESEGDRVEARREYRTYLERSPAAKDRRYYATKIDVLEQEPER